MADEFTAVARHVKPICTALLLGVTLACTAKGPSMKPTETRSTELALDFARAIASDDWASAHALLSSDLQSVLTPERLAAAYKEMVAYGSGAPTTIQVMTTMDTWPDKQRSDLEWVYVALANDTYSEAVTVVVSQEQSRPVIRSIEWGRP